jgi:hypothetical protein
MSTIDKYRDKSMYYADMIKHSEMQYLQCKTANDKLITLKQVNEFIRLKKRYTTLCSKLIIAQNQAKLF